MKQTHVWTSLFIVLFSTQALGFFRSFPIEPNIEQTPGSLCEQPSDYKYPEDIPYCHRKVSKSTKNRVISIYEKKLGFEIYKYDRRNFKIDHLIPLCIGGSNEVNNLWPQHRSVYEITDPLENVVCIKLQQGRILQVDAVDMVLEAKHNLEKAKNIIELVDSL